MLNKEIFNQLVIDFHDVLKNNNILLKSIWEEFEFNIKNNSNELYLQISITINNKIVVQSNTTYNETNSMIKNNEIINYSNSLLDYDEYTIIGNPTYLNDQQYNILNGTIDIMVHPTYNIPCPYLRIWYQHTGKLLDHVEINQLMKFFNYRNSTDNNINNLSIYNNIYYNNITDHRIYSFGQLENEMHPILDTPCYSIHVCMLQDLMKESILTYQYHHYDRTKLNSLSDSTITCNAYHSFYLLNWISLVGNFIGFHITTEDYTSLSKLLCT